MDTNIPLERLLTTIPLINVFSSDDVTYAKCPFGWSSQKLYNDINAILLHMYVCNLPQMTWNTICRELTHMSIPLNGWFERNETRLCWLHFIRFPSKTFFTSYSIIEYLEMEWCRILYLCAWPAVFVVHV